LETRIQYSMEYGLIKIDHPITNILPKQYYLTNTQSGYFHGERKTSPL
jgi:hypothetical protein